MPPSLEVYQNNTLPQRLYKLHSSLKVYINAIVKSMPSQTVISLMEYSILKKILAQNMYRMTLSSGLWMNNFPLVVCLNSYNIFQNGLFYYWKSGCCIYTNLKGGSVISWSVWEECHLGKSQGRLVYFIY